MRPNTNRRQILLFFFLGVYGAAGTINQNNDVINISTSSQSKLSVFQYRRHLRKHQQIGDLMYHESGHDTKHAGVRLSVSSSPNNDSVGTTGKGDEKQVFNEAWQNFLLDFESLTYTTRRKRISQQQIQCASSTVLISEKSRKEVCKKQKSDSDENETLLEPSSSEKHLVVADGLNPRIDNENMNVFSTKLINSHTVHAKKRLIKAAFKRSPSLLSLYYVPNGDLVMQLNNSTPLCNLVEIVGPIPKEKLVNMIVKHPDLMANVLNSLDELKTTKTIIEQNLKLSPNQTDKLIKRIPVAKFLLQRRSYRTDVQFTFSYFLHTLSISQDDLRKVYTSTPQLMTYSLSKIKESVHYFEHELGFDPKKDVGRMIRSAPLVLAHGLETKIKPTINFLKVDLGIDSWKRMIVRYPQLFSYPVHSLTPKAKILQSRLKLQRWSDVSFVISGFPPLLWLSEENIAKKVEFIQTTLGCDNDEMRDIFVTYPQILGLSIENNLKPKFEFFLSPLVIEGSLPSGAGLKLEELRYMVMYQPALMAYSLDGRIRPRIQLLKENYISFNYAPPYLMSLSNEKFHAWLEVQKSTWTVQ